MIKCPVVTLEVGRRFANYRVTREVTVGLNSLSRVPVACVTCGEEYEFRARNLRDKHRVFENTGVMPGCHKCMNSQFRHQTQGKGCRQCEGMAHRRPENGKPCACGEIYRALPPITFDPKDSKHGVGAILAGGTICL